MTASQFLQDIVDWVKNVERRFDVEGDVDEVEEDQEMMTDEDNCSYIVLWNSISATCKTDSTFTFVYERQELAITQSRTARRLYDMIADEFSPELWLYLDDGEKRVLLHRRGTLRNFDTGTQNL